MRKRRNWSPEGSFDYAESEKKFEKDHSAFKYYPILNLPYKNFYLNKSGNKLSIQHVKSQTYDPFKGHFFPRV